MNHQTRTTDAMNDQTRTDRARRGERSWGIPSASVAFAAKQANEWHRWYAWRPVICDNASGGVAWGLTILYPGIIFDFLKVWKRWESKVSRAALCVV